MGQIRATDDFYPDKSTNPCFEVVLSGDNKLLEIRSLPTIPCLFAEHRRLYSKIRCLSMQHSRILSTECDPIKFVGYPDVRQKFHSNQNRFLPPNKPYNCQRLKTKRMTRQPYHRKKKCWDRAKFQVPNIRLTADKEYFAVVIHYF